MLKSDRNLILKSDNTYTVCICQIMRPVWQLIVSWVFGRVWTCTTNINSLGSSVDCESSFSGTVFSVVCQNNAKFRSWGTCKFEMCGKIKENTDDKFSSAYGEDCMCVLVAQKIAVKGIKTERSIQLLLQEAITV